MRARTTLALAALLAVSLAGCADDAPAAVEGPRVSKAAEPQVARPEPFATDLQAIGLLVGPEGRINAVTESGFSGTPSGNLTELRIDVTWQPVSLPLRVCLQDATSDALVAEVPCVEGTGEAHIVWDNATAGLPGGIPGGFRRVAYFSEAPQVIGVLQQHVEGVTVS